ncbi:hypothetical protein ABZP36_031005 [Zizania latifolia]
MRWGFEMNVVRGGIARASNSNCFKAKTAAEVVSNRSSLRFKSRPIPSRSQVERTRARIPVAPFHGTGSLEERTARGRPGQGSDVGWRWTPPAAEAAAAAEDGGGK